MNKLASAIAMDGKTVEKGMSGKMGTFRSSVPANAVRPKPVPVPSPSTKK